MKQLPLFFLYFIYVQLTAYAFSFFSPFAVLQVSSKRSYSCRTTTEALLIHSHCISTKISQNTQEISEMFLAHDIFFHHIDIIFLLEAIFHFICLLSRKEKKPIYLFEHKYLTSIKTSFRTKVFETLNKGRKGGKTGKKSKKTFKMNNFPACCI